VVEDRKELGGCQGILFPSKRRISRTPRKLLELGEGDRIPAAGSGYARWPHACERV